MALKNDCFALPAGVEWTPVDKALALLRDRLSPVIEIEALPLAEAQGRILARDVMARTATPPADNSAVDGYALAHASLNADKDQYLTLLEGRSAAGAPFAGSVPIGHAVRILTGAIMPKDTDTVVMDEDVDLIEGSIRFGSGLKSGANRRKAGEDMRAGATALMAQTRLGPAHLAQAASVGIASLLVRKKLRVTILSTGDELREPEYDLIPGQIFDANRPMLLSLARAQGAVVRDGGCVPDTSDAVADALKKAADVSDVVIVSGGASGGDEDHVARELSAMGAMSLWRIAMKPGRPLALGQIGNVPVFGLPGNPVAAFTCFALFARPALLALAGAGWHEPLSFPVISAFHAKKKPGRSEYLRGRLAPDGTVEKYHSDGSGLIGGLTWSNGFIALDHARGPVKPGETVRFIPYSGLGI